MTHFTPSWRMLFWEECHEEFLFLLLFPHLFINVSEHWDTRLFTLKMRLG